MLSKIDPTHVKTTFKENVANLMLFSKQNFQPSLIELCKLKLHFHQNFIYLFSLIPFQQKFSEKKKDENTKIKEMKYLKEL